MSQELLDHLQDLLRRTRWHGRLKARAMFGGHGLYLDGRMCAIVFSEALYLKTDAVNRAEFIERGLAPFVYLMKGKPMPLSYYQVPAEALEDGAELARWLESAFAAAGRRAAARAEKGTHTIKKRGRPVFMQASPSAPKAPRPKASPPRRTR